MTSRVRPLLALGLGAASALALVGCAADADSTATDDGRVSVVASTNVYGEIAEEIGGDLVDVTALVHKTSQDPHSYEATAQDQLAVASADLLIENGGGYDPFLDTLIEGSGSTAPVITAVEYSHDWPANAEADDADHEAGDDHDHDHGDHGHVEGFNEHVWYDLHTVEHVAEAISEELSELDPANKATYEANAEAFAAQIEGIEGDLAAIGDAHGGEDVFATEPVPYYLVRDAGLDDVTPADFSEAVEEGNDVAPATLLEAINLLKGGTVSVVIQNSQTGGPETTRVVAEAESAGIPVIAFSETLPEGQTYISWMQANTKALAEALDA